MAGHLRARHASAFAGEGSVGVRRRSRGAAVSGRAQLRALAQAAAVVDVSREFDKSSLRGPLSTALTFFIFFFDGPYICAAFWQNSGKFLLHFSHSIRPNKNWPTSGEILIN